MRDLSNTVFVIVKVLLKAVQQEPETEISVVSNISRDYIFNIEYNSSLFGMYLHKRLPPLNKERMNIKTT